MNKRKTYFLLIFFSLLLSILSIGVRVWWGVETELKLAREELAKSELRKTAIHYEKLILWRYPLGSYTGEAVNELKRLTHHKDPIVRTYANHALAFSITCVQTGKKKIGNLPDPFWSSVLGLSLVGWVCAACLLIFRGFSHELKLQKKSFFVFLVMLVFLLTIWVYSLEHL